MKLLSMIFMIVLGASSVWAQVDIDVETTDSEIFHIITVTGRGEDYRHCRPPAGFCIDDVKRRAEQAGLQDAKRTCEINHQGRQTAGSGYCSTSCFPSYIPPSGRPEYVNCRSNCQISCEMN